MTDSVTPALPPHSDGVNLCLAELLHYKNKTVRWLPPAQSVWSQLNGHHQSRRKGRGMNFSEVRPYQPGDDIRAIDWRVTARTGKTHTKLFTEEREQPVMLLVDMSASMQFGSQLMLKSVQAAHFASLLSWLAVSEQDRIGAMIYTGSTLIECKPTARQQGPLRVINALIDAHRQHLMLSHSATQPQTRLPFADALKHLHHLCPKGSEIVILSDFYQLAMTDKRRLSQLRQHNRIQFVQLFDPLESGQTAFSGTAYVADQEKTAWLDFSSQKTRQGLNEQYQQLQAFLHSLCKSLAIPLHPLSAAIPLMMQLGMAQNGRNAESGNNGSAS
ncbi:DUF58 domain-containing protein [Photobacterium ganghwense]|uniref:Cytosolic protein n=1 Tax=Photobacterium ganghwense TaxID=320778 RepID=A0A0J1K7H3_9GAMM|nr:DUF58 domain-containing protein [Photobacterium ganghwense]KLV10287.1 cytosolic protein [Photobacterium ganghwense]PSU09828.1 DUF58 domain-containing protein [Photobacterium ganghwense]QSV17074.1 DUF58 domain-containing protein [Photobacterium ganghwense]